MSAKNYPRLKITKLYKLVNLSLNRLYKQNNCDITSEQGVIIGVLFDNPGTSQHELASKTGQDKDNISKTIKILSTKGIIQKQRAVTDNRKFEIYLTPVGKKLYLKIQKIITEWRENLFLNASLEDVESFEKICNQFIFNLQECANNATRKSNK